MNGNTNHKILDRTRILKGALNRRDLSVDQSKAIEDIINGFSLLVSSSIVDLPSRGDVEVFSEIIKGSVIHTLRILDVYVKPREGQGSFTAAAGRS